MLPRRDAARLLARRLHAFPSQVLQSAGAILDGLTPLLAPPYAPAMPLATCLPQLKSLLLAVAASLPAADADVGGNPGPTLAGVTEHASAAAVDAPLAAALGWWAWDVTAPLTHWQWPGGRAAKAHGGGRGGGSRCGALVFRVDACVHRRDGAHTGAKLRALALRAPQMRLRPCRVDALRLTSEPHVFWRAASLPSPRAHAGWCCCWRSSSAWASPPPGATSSGRSCTRCCCRQSPHSRCPPTSRRVPQALSPSALRACHAMASAVRTVAPVQSAAGRAAVCAEKRHGNEGLEMRAYAWRGIVAQVMALVTGRVYHLLRAEPQLSRWAAGTQCIARPPLSILQARKPGACCARLPPSSPAPMGAGRRTAPCLRRASSCSLPTVRVQVRAAPRGGLLVLITPPHSVSLEHTSGGV